MIRHAGETRSDTEGLAHRDPLHAPAVATRRQAIQEYMDDLEDLHIAERRLFDHCAGESAAMPLHEVMKRYGMDDLA